MAVKLQQIHEHLDKIERELAELRELLKTTSKEEKPLEILEDIDIESLKSKLRQEGFDEELVQLVGTVPLFCLDSTNPLLLGISRTQRSKSPCER